MPKIILALVLGFVLAIAVFSFKNFGTKQLAENVTPQIAQKAMASPSPFPFEELTIPYLRAKEFKSSLGELQPVSENQNYISYLTSYHSEGLKINGLLTKPNTDEPEGG